jgi:hypothetical protein
MMSKNYRYSLVIAILYSLLVPVLVLTVVLPTWRGAPPQRGVCVEYRTFDGETGSAYVAHIATPVTADGITSCRTGVYVPFKR